MSKTKLTAPVGLSPRESKGEKVKNKAADVVLVRKMLEANNIGPLGESGSIDSGLLKAIKKFQSKIGFKKPDMVVDPGGKTFGALVKKYDKALAEVAKIPMVEVTYKGKVLTLTKKDHELLVKDVFNKLDSYYKSLVSNHENCLRTQQHYLDVAMIKDGLLNAVAQALIVTAGSVKMPSSSIIGRSIRATGMLQAAFSRKDLALLNTALPEAEAAITALNAEILRFLKEFTGSAQTTATVLGVASAGCFAIVGVLAVPVLVTSTALSATGALVVSGGSVAVLKSGSEELGKHASGMKVTLWDSLRAVTVDGTVGLLTAGIGNKIPLGFVTKISKALAPKLASKIAFMSTQQLEKFISNYLVGSGTEVIKGAVGEGIKLVGIMAKTGKVPTEKDFDKAVEALIYAALLGGLVKNLGSFQKKWAFKNRETLQGTIFPARLAKLAKEGNNIPNTLKAGLWADVMNKVSNEALKAGHHEVYSRATGKESEKKLTDMAARALLKDKGLQKIIDQELIKAMKKHGIAAK